MAELGKRVAARALTILQRSRSQALDRAKTSDQNGDKHEYAKHRAHSIVSAVELVERAIQERPLDSHGRHDVLPGATHHSCGQIACPFRARHARQPHVGLWSPP